MAHKEDHGRQSHVVSGPRRSRRSRLESETVWSIDERAKHDGKKRSKARGRLREHEVRAGDRPELTSSPFFLE